MNSFGDIVKHNNNFDETLKTPIGRYVRCKSTANRVLVTESGHLVASYDTDNELVPYESWSFPQLNRLSSPVITYVDTNDGNEYMVAIQEPNSLTKWSFGDNKTRVEKHFFNTSIVGLVDFDIQNVEPMVVFDNGFCQSMSKAIQNRREELQKQIIGADECIISMDGLVDKEMKDYLVVYLVTKSAQSDDRRIKSLYKISICIETDVMVKTECYSVVNEFTNWSLCRRTQTLLSITQSDDGLAVYSLDGVSEKPLFKPLGTSIDKMMGLVATSAGSVCLIGKTRDSNYLMELWETRYGSKLGAITLPSEPLVNDCKVIDDSVFITCFKAMVCVPLKVQTISLSQIVGKVASKEFDKQLTKQLKTICRELESPTSGDDNSNEFSSRLNELVEQNGGNIPEDIILRLLMICSTKLSQQSCQQWKDLFERLVSLPFNEVFMISRLKSLKLEFPQILLILSLLSELLPSKKCAVFDWISILIDSHINQFVMNPNEETVKVLDAIDLKVDTSGQFYEHLGQIKTLMDIIVSKNGDKNIGNGGLTLPKPKRGQYCIEILRF